MPDRERIEDDGPPPSPSDDDPQVTMEEHIEEMHRPYGSNEHTTALEQRRGDSIDDRVGREEPDVGDDGPADAGTTLVDDDAPDTEADLTGDMAAVDDHLAPEESAMRVVAEAPGATDHEDDYVEE
jgi:hypothetical protein